MRSILHFVGAVALVAAAAAAVSAEDWPQWRGADRLAVWDETGIVEELPEELRVAWRTPVRSGYSGPAVADGRIFITDWMEDPESRTLDGTERALALDERTGEVLWT
ncbi:MAG: PQQ-binding-like beta-propeller repeat protein, partial [Acidobacteria bacterium]|nr:PQQ-binding-like beta-propeller repeat protein [Acidobacteriota bacterium]